MCSIRRSGDRAALSVAIATTFSEGGFRVVRQVFQAAFGRNTLTDGLPAEAAATLDQGLAAELELIYGASASGGAVLNTSADAAQRRKDCFAAFKSSARAALQAAAQCRGCAYRAAVALLQVGFCVCSGEPFLQLV